MVTNNQEEIKRKDVVKIMRVGGIIIIINQRTTLTMIDRTIMLVRERKRSRR
jgi:hypothetical protein